MANTKVKLRFLATVRHGFAADTPGYEAKTLGDDYVYQYKTFEEGDEFEFPANEYDAAKALVEAGAAVRVGKETPADDSSTTT